YYIPFQLEKNSEIEVDYTIGTQIPSKTSINTAVKNVILSHTSLPLVLFEFSIRTSLLGYCVSTVFMFPLMYLCAYTGTVKVVAVFNTIKYCQSVLRIVVMKLDYLKKLPSSRSRADALSDVWQLHQRALRCVELLEIILQPLLLMQFCTGFNVKFINMFLLFLFVTIDTFGYCYLGTQLSQEIRSINVAQALYDCDWCDGATKRCLVFMILRTQCRVGLTAAKFRLVDMEQFGAMLNMSYSFFVVLKDAL
uniref:Uncharacterized protein n=1 Tax=Anopheles minimus TaxID=112268 RepID=A0A182VUR3_9DIPT